MDSLSKTYPLTMFPRPEGDGRNDRESLRSSVVAAFCRPGITVEDATVELGSL